MVCIRNIHVWESVYTALKYITHMKCILKWVHCVCHLPSCEIFESAARFRFQIIDCFRNIIFYSVSVSHSIWKRNQRKVKIYITWTTSIAYSESRRNAKLFADWMLVYVCVWHAMHAVLYMPYMLCICRRISVLHLVLYASLILCTKERKAQQETCSRFVPLRCLFFRF